MVAKPAEQTPLIASVTVGLLHDAGIPKSALQLVTGDGKIGAALVADPSVAGVAFTGSTQVGLAINRALAAKDGPIAPLIAETGGINAMIVDATALPEQVTDDVVMSTFRSAGQRCSALRLLCVQDDVADKLIEMISGAAAELSVGDPREIATHVGPVIDAEAKERLDKWIAAHQARVRYRAKDRPGERHVRAADDHRTRPRVGSEGRSVRTRSCMLCAGSRMNSTRLLDEIAGNGTGLTLGIHSRIDARIAEIAARMRNGNVYVNRSMIGAVVGTQPFGGTRHVRHRTESRRAELSAPLRDRAGGHGEHGRGRRQCELACKR